MTDDWKLTAEQFRYIYKHSAAIHTARKTENMTALSELESSAEYKAILGTIAIEDAYKRYQIMTTWNI